MNLVKAELMKSTSTRMVWGLLAGALGLTLLNVVANVLTAGQEGAGPPLDTAQGLRNVFGASSGATVFVLMLGVLSVTGEIRHGTITTSFLAVPRRMKLVAAKLVALPILAAGFAAAVTLLTVVIAVPLIAVREGNVAWGDAGLVGVLAGSFAAITLYPVLGIGFACLIRNQVAAVISALVWVLIAEAILVSFVPEIGKWTPGGAAAAMTRLAPVSGGELLSPAAGALIFVAYGALLAAIGAHTTLRRDIT